MKPTISFIGHLPCAVCCVKYSTWRPYLILMPIRKAQISPFYRYRDWSLRGFYAAWPAKVTSWKFARLSKYTYRSPVKFKFHINNEYFFSITNVKYFMQYFIWQSHPDGKGWLWTGIQVSWFSGLPVVRPWNSLKREETSCANSWTPSRHTD